MKITENFTMEELTHSGIAERNGIQNYPDQKALGNLVRLANSLQEIRGLINSPLTVNSGFRCQDVERILKKKPDDWISHSQHTKGNAADIRSHVFGTPYKLAETIINSPVKFDQLILEFNSWVHFGLSDGKWRNQVLTAMWVDGEVVYYSGLRQ